MRRNVENVLIIRESWKLRSEYLVTNPLRGSSLSVHPQRHFINTLRHHQKHEYRSEVTSTWRAHSVLPSTLYPYCVQTVLLGQKMLMGSLWKTVGSFLCLFHSFDDLWFDTFPILWRIMDAYLLTIVWDTWRARKMTHRSFGAPVSSYFCDEASTILIDWSVRSWHILQ